MEEKEAETEKQPVMPKNDKFFATIGKLAVLLILGGALIFGGYYLGTNLNKNQNPTPTPTISQTQSNSQTTVTSTIAPTNQITSAVTVTPASEWKTVHSGGVGGSSFKQYRIDIPSGWKDTKDTTPNISDKLTVTNGAYSLSIYQAAFGGGGCIYPGDADQMMSQKFSDFVGITGASNTFRRSWNKTGNPAGTITYTICQKGNDSYGSVTSFGAIGVKSPDPADAKMMSQIDSMISSLVTEQ